MIIPDRENRTHTNPPLPSDGPCIQVSGVSSSFSGCRASQLSSRGPSEGVQLLGVLRKNSGSTNLLLTFNHCRPDDMCYYSVCRKEEASEGNLCYQMALRPLSATPATSRKHKASSRTVHWLLLHLLPPVGGYRWSKNWLFPQGAHVLPDPILFCFTSLFLQLEISSNRWTKEGRSGEVEKECHVSMVICNKVKPLTVPGLISKCSLIGPNL